MSLADSSRESLSYSGFQRDLQRHSIGDPRDNKYYIPSYPNTSHERVASNPIISHDRVGSFDEEVYQASLNRRRYSSYGSESGLEDTGRLSGRLSQGTGYGGSGYLAQDEYEEEWSPDSSRVTYDKPYYGYVRTAANNSDVIKNGGVSQSDSLLERTVVSTKDDSTFVDPDKVHVVNLSRISEVSFENSPKNSKAKTSTQENLNSYQSPQPEVNNSKNKVIPPERSSSRSSNTTPIPQRPGSWSSNSISVPPRPNTTPIPHRSNSRSSNPTPVPPRPSSRSSNATPIPPQHCSRSSDVTPIPPRPSSRSSNVTPIPPRPSSMSSNVTPIPPRPSSMSSNVTPTPQRADEENVSPDVKLSAVQSSKNSPIYTNISAKSLERFFVQPMDLSEPLEDLLGLIQVCSLKLSEIPDLQSSKLNRPVRAPHRNVLPAFTVRLWSRSSGLYVCILPAAAGVYARAPFGPSGHLRLLVKDESTVMFQSSSSPQHHLCMKNGILRADGVGSEESEFKISQDSDGYCTFESVSEPGSFMGVRENGNVMAANHVKPGTTHAQFIIQKEAMDLL